MQSFNPIEKDSLHVLIRPIDSDSKKTLNKIGKHEALNHYH